MELDRLSQASLLRHPFCFYVVLLLFPYPVWQAREELR